MPQPVLKNKELLPGPELISLRRPAFAFNRKGFFSALFFGCLFFVNCITPFQAMASWAGYMKCVCTWGGPSDIIWYWILVGWWPTQPQCQSGTQSDGMSTCVAQCAPDPASIGAIDCIGADSPPPIVSPPGGGESGSLSNLGGNGITSGAGGLANDFGISRLTGLEQGQATFTSHATRANKQWMEEAMSRQTAIAPLRPTPVPKTTLDYERNYLKKTAPKAACAGVSGPCIGSLNKKPDLLGEKEPPAVKSPNGKQNGDAAALNRKIPVPIPDHNASKGGVSGAANALFTLNIAPNGLDPVGSINIALNKIGDFAAKHGFSLVEKTAKGGITAAAVSATGDGKVEISVGFQVGKGPKFAVAYGLESEGHNIKKIAGTTTEAESGPVGAGVSDKGEGSAKVKAGPIEAEGKCGDGKCSGKVAIEIAPGLKTSLEKDTEGNTKLAAEAGKTFEGPGGLKGEAKITVEGNVKETTASKSMVGASVYLAKSISNSAAGKAVGAAAQSASNAAESLAKKADSWMGWTPKEAPKIQPSPFAEEPK